MNSSYPQLRRLLLLFSLLLFCAVAGLIIRSIAMPERYNVIVLTIESFREDRLRNDVAPNLMKAFEDGYRFTRHRAVSGWTGTNIITILTGLSPFQTGVHTRGQSVPEDLATPLEKLSHLQYRVEGIQGFMGMNIYRHLGLEVHPQSDDPLYWLALRRKHREAFFFWYHYVHTHLPYNASAEYTSPFAKKLDHKMVPAAQADRLSLVRESGAIHYSKTEFQQEDIDLVHELQDSTIREFDSWFAHFFEFFKKSGLHKNTILIVTADHGDEHGERGLVGHASTTQLGHLHEEIVRVPLFIRLPDNLVQKTNFDVTAFDSNHEDIMPTLFSLLGIEPPIPLSGRDLFGEPRHSNWKAMTSSGGFAEEDTQNIRYFDYAVLKDSMKLMLRICRSGKETKHLFDLEKDPGERIDLAAAKPATTRNLLATIRPHIAARTILTNTSQKYPLQQDSPAPAWLYPEKSGTHSYDDMKGNSILLGRARK